MSSVSLAVKVSSCAYVLLDLRFVTVRTRERLEGDVMEPQDQHFLVIYITLFARKQCLVFNSTILSHELSSLMRKTFLFSNHYTHFF